MKLNVDFSYGPSIPSAGWAPSPRYILRRSRILHWLTGSPRDSLLEIGCGAGTLLYEIEQLGFAATGLETSVSALSIARAVNQHSGTSIHEQARAVWKGSFGYVCAFEVLEHIEDDVAALEDWHSWLKPEGRLILSVPAHMRKWSHSDVWAGHVKRYEKEELESLITLRGFSIERFECLGFPLNNVLGHFRNSVHRRELQRTQRAEQADRKLNNDMSGVSRQMESKLFYLLKNPVGRLGMRAAIWLQKMTLMKDWGDGYLVVARKV